MLLPLDLHVLSMPPAFTLSQDQTLHKYPNPADALLISKLSIISQTYPPFGIESILYLPSLVK